MSQFVTPIDLNRDVSMRRLIASLGHLDEGILGSEIVGGYVSPAIVEAHGGVLTVARGVERGATFAATSPRL